VADADLRVELHARLWRSVDAEAVHALEDELGDRFGPLPEAVTNLLEMARLRVRCREVGVAALDVGPVGAAARLRAGVTGDVAAPLVLNGRRVTLARASGDGVGRFAVARGMLDLLEK
jgi:transcription-repair coupling factor (superfamily II helicase)